MTAFKKLRISGQEFTIKSPNSKYAELDDLDNLYKELQKMSIGDYSKKVGVPQNSVRYRVFHYFPQDWIRNIVKARNYHFNQPRKKIDGENQADV